MIESLIYYTVKIIGAFIRFLPVGAALWIGRMVGLVAYYFDIKHKSIVYANLKLAFAKTKTPHEIKKITKQVFQNYGQNTIELLRLPLMTPQKFEECVEMEGKEHALKALNPEGGQGKGLILLAMHSGSWELANFGSGLLGRPYKVIVKPQKRFSRLDALLNSYRECSGSVIIERGMGTREFIKSLRNNEIVGMVVDQGGREGVLTPLFGRQASMSIGAIRIGLKLGVPICFAAIVRKKGSCHRFIIHKPMELIQTGDVEEDIKANLNKIAKIMEKYLEEFPAEYMWFYKIWKYAKEAVILVLNDGKTGHLRQSETVAASVEKALKERGTSSTTKILDVSFKSPLAARLMSGLSVFANHYICQGRLGFMRRFLTEESFTKMMSVKADFIISCGSSTAAVNYLLSTDQQAKSLVVLKPGILNFNRFDLVILPRHDHPAPSVNGRPILVIEGAANLITPEYLQRQSDLLLKRFSHLKNRENFKIGLLLGGDTKDYVLSEQKVKMVVHQIKEISEELKADILVSTSRRTSVKIENMLQRELKKYARCQLLIFVSHEDVPAAVGGILGLSDIVVVSGDSISMICEAASSGKKTIVFPVQDRINLIGKKHKHRRFIDALSTQGYILSSDPKAIRQSIYDLAKNKIQTKKLNDHEVILEGVRKII